MKSTVSKEIAPGIRIEKYEGDPPLPTIPAKPRRKCGSCKFMFKVMTGDTQITQQCRRNPPNTEENTFSRFPLVNNEMWCGEYSEKDDE